MKVIPTPEATIELYKGKQVLLSNPDEVKLGIEPAPGFHIAGDGTYVLVGIEESERELIKRSWCFFLGFHGPVPVFSLRVADMFTEEDLEPDIEIPRIPATYDLKQEARDNWGWMHEGYALPVGGECTVETPEGFKPATLGDYIYHDPRSGDFWIFSSTFINRFGWSFKSREQEADNLSGESTT